MRFVTLVKRDLKRAWGRSNERFNHNKGFTHIYTDLLYLLTAGMSEVSIFWLLLWFIVPVFLAIPLTYSNIEVQQIVFIIGTFYFFIASYILFVFFGGLFALKESSKAVFFIATRILTGVPKPYFKNEKGLNYKEIAHLQRIAEIEQSSADWRGFVSSTIIIGTGVILGGLSYSNLRQILFATEDMAFESELMRNIPFGVYGNLPSLPMENFITPLIIIISIVNLFLYFVRFFTRESANRTILYACQEALALLETFECVKTEKFTHLQKKALAAHLGCRLIMGADANFLERIIGSPIINEIGDTWLIIPPTKYSYQAKFVVYLSRLGKSIKRTLFPSNVNNT